METLEKLAKGLEGTPLSLFYFKHIDTENNEALTTFNLIDIHHSLLKSRSDKEIKLIHNTVKDILLLLDSKNPFNIR